MKVLAITKHAIRHSISDNGIRYNVAKIIFGRFTITESGVPSNALLAEDGSPILNEDGSYILVE